MAGNRQAIDMLHGRIWTKVLWYALPVAATGMALMSMAPSFERGEVFANRLVRERARYGALVRKLGITPS